jgi:hypothetical protein
VDNELLARLLSALRDVPDVDLSLSGFDGDEVSKLLRSMNAREKREREESFDLDAALEAARAAPRAQRGDLWALGDHRLACGDATDSADVVRLLDGKHAALAFCDPPITSPSETTAVSRRASAGAASTTTPYPSRNGRPSAAVGHATFSAALMAPSTSA